MFIIKYSMLIVAFLSIGSLRSKTFAASDNIRALYLNAFSLTGQRFDDAVQIIRKTDMNAFVIDVKDVRGFLVYQSEIAQKIIPSAIRKNAQDLKSLVQRIKQSANNDVYTIARLVVFKDNYYPEKYPWATIKNENNQPYLEKNSLKWIDPHNKNYWDYIVNIAKECYDAGFDEVQLDYIRFPGTKEKLIFPFKKDKGELNRAEMIATFLKYIRNKLSDYNKPLSIDIFGLVGNVPGSDLGVGQVWNLLSPHTDIMSPMMYPSHYPKGFGGISNPDTEPFLVIDKTISRSIASNKKASTSAIIRPWIQAFTAKWLQEHLEYNQIHLLEQVQALKKNGINGYLVWHPGSKYRSFYPHVFKDKNAFLSNEKESLVEEDDNRLSYE